MTATKIMPRWSLTVAATAHAGLFAWVAVIVPWEDLTALGVLTSGLAGGYALTAVLAALRHRTLAVVWRAQSALSLGFFAYLLWRLASAALQVRSLYAGLGDGVAAALIAACVLPAAFTVPLGLWGLGATGPIRSRKTTLVATVLLIAYAALTTLGDVRAMAAERRLSDADVQTLAAQIAAQVDPAARPVAKRRPSLHNAAPVECDAAVSHAELTLIATYPEWRGAKKRPRARGVCLQGSDPHLIASKLAALVAQQGAHGPIKIDIVTATATLDESRALAGLSIRPGLDGICLANRCLMPWQLVLRNVFNAHQITAAVPDARLGASLAALRKALRNSDAPLKRIETASFVLTADGVLNATRRTADEIAITPTTLATARREATRYIIGAQKKNGQFHYLIDPFKGRSISAGRMSVARHAGTTLALCELGGTGRRVRSVIAKATAMLASLEHQLPNDRGVLRRPKAEGQQQSVGASALSLAALLRCRKLTGKKHDALIGRIASMLLTQQRDDGSFAHKLDMTTGTATADRGSLYVDGQIVLGLVLLEKVADAQDGVFPSRATLGQAIDRAMSWVANDYWSHFGRTLFFIEENWHCLAAEAALDHHRHDGYERFCLDYLEFKSRLVHRDSRNVHPDFIGGYGVGSIVPPHNTATAGFGEALAAGIKIRRARGETRADDDALMQQVLGYLLRNQWTRDRCWACAPRRRIEGGFSEHMASPLIRIDYVQHSMAAIGHGAEALFAAEP